MFRGRNFNSWRGGFLCFVIGFCVSDAMYRVLLKAIFVPVRYVGVDVLHYVVISPLVANNVFMKARLPYR